MVQERYYFFADNDRVQLFSSDITYSHSFGKEVSACPMDMAFDTWLYSD